MALLLNLLFRSEWLALAVLMLTLHWLVQLPLLFVWLCLGIWVIFALAITLFTGWLSRTSDIANTPGSKRSSERIGKFKNDNQ